MMSRSFFKLAVAGTFPAIATLLFLPLAEGQEISASARESTEVETVDLDVLMRGPVHEAFAEPAVSVKAEARGTFELPEPVPDPIDEEPAFVRPTDPNREAIWVPGYWGVEEGDQLVWVSGTWRYAPPGMRWVPGYWADTDGDLMWVAGFWIDETMEEVAYLPPPPDPRAIDRPQAPGNDYFWVPGHWDWRDGEYVWHAGFWAKAQPSWVWVPARYIATPRGYVYVQGYWDYPPDRRGTLFAPVRFASVRSGYRYRPTVVINTTRALVHWFVHPTYGHYYFGNYYGDRYRDFGLRPWVAYADNRNVYYDPLYTYYSVAQTDFLRSLVTTRQQLATRTDVNLPVSYREYQQVVAQGSAPEGIANFALSADQLVSEGPKGQFENLEEITGADATRRTEQMRERVESFRRFVQGRRQVELDGQAQRSRPDGESLRDRDEQPDRRLLDRDDADDDPRLLDRDAAERLDDVRPDTDRPDADRPDVDRPDVDRATPDARARARQEADRETPGESPRERRRADDAVSPFDLRPFSRRAESAAGARTDAERGRADADARAEADARDDADPRGEARARGEAAVRGEAPGQLRREGSDAFTPPPRPRNPAEAREGDRPDLGGAAERARGAVGSEARENRGAPGARGNRGEQGNRGGQADRIQPGNPAAPADNATPQRPTEPDVPDAAKTPRGAGNAGDGQGKPGGGQGKPGGGSASDDEKAPE